MRRLMLSMFACLGLISAAACGTSVQIDSGFVILDTSPSGGAVNVDPDVELFVVLSQEVDESTIEAGVMLKDADGADVTATKIALTGDKRVLSIAPGASLASDTAYELHILGSLKSASGETLDATINKRFRTAP
jgi:hypothetical protein